MGKADVLDSCECRSACSLERRDQHIQANVATTLDPAVAEAWAFFRKMEQLGGFLRVFIPHSFSSSRICRAATLDE